MINNYFANKNNLPEQVNENSKNIDNLLARVTVLEGSGVGSNNVYTQGLKTLSLRNVDNDTLATSILNLHNGNTPPIFVKLKINTYEADTLPDNAPTIKNYSTATDETPTIDNDYSTSADTLSNLISLIDNRLWYVYQFFDSTIPPSLNLYSGTNLDTNGIAQNYLSHYMITLSSLATYVRKFSDVHYNMSNSDFTNGEATFEAVTEGAGFSGTFDADIYYLDPTASEEFKNTLAEMDARITELENDQPIDVSVLAERVTTLEGQVGSIESTLTSYGLRFVDIENDIDALQSGKQDKLTAGSNITISEQNVISATDTTYSNLPAQENGQDVSLVSTGEKYTWNEKQDKIIAGTNITIDSDGKTISASGGSYSLGYEEIDLTTFIATPTIDNLHAVLTSNATTIENALKSGKRIIFDSGLTGTTPIISYQYTKWVINMTDSTVSQSYGSGNTDFSYGPFEINRILFSGAYIYFCITPIHYNSREFLFQIGTSGAPSKLFVERIHKSDIFREDSNTLSFISYKNKDNIGLDYRDATGYSADTFSPTLRIYDKLQSS